MFSIAPALAACGSGQTPGYGDISSVRYEKTACYGVCPSFEVSFSRAGLTYTGRDNVARIGNYTSSETGKFDDVVALLSRLQFYSFKVKPVFVTDVPHYIISVERCGVNTSLDWRAMVYTGASGGDFGALFNGLDRITNSVVWRKAP